MIQIDLSEFLNFSVWFFYSLGIVLQSGKTHQEVCKNTVVFKIKLSEI